MKKTNPKNQKTKDSGFTLLEMLIAIFIFSLALVSLTTISSRGIAVANNAINQSIAHFLAQEGIEMVESKRDDNFLNFGNEWLDGLQSECGDENGCYASPIIGGGNLQFTTCNDNGCPFLRVSTGGAYGYTGDEETIFRRSIYLQTGTIEVTGQPIPEDVIVRSTVEWQRNGVNFSVEASKDLFNWFQ